MAFKLLYWYWLVFGMVLIIAELIIPSFTIFSESHGRAGRR
jgi:membrane protein implicated in regulation of membrane protease activity